MDIIKDGVEHGFNAFCLVRILVAVQKVMYIEPMGKVPIDPEQPLYAVRMERNAFDFPQRVCPLHCPKPVGSVLCPPCNIATRLPVVMVMNPPD